MKSTGGSERVESEIGVVAADDGTCSEIGASMLRKGGHAVDAAVAAAICSGVLHPMSSGIGGGAFIIVRSSADGKAEAFDARETAPAAASKVRFSFYDWLLRFCFGFVIVITVRFRFYGDIKCMSSSLMIEEKVMQQSICIVVRIIRFRPIIII